MKTRHCSQHTCYVCCGISRPSPFQLPIFPCENSCQLWAMYGQTLFRPIFSSRLINGYKLMLWYQIQLCISCCHQRPSPLTKHLSKFHRYIWDSNVVRCILMSSLLVFGPVFGYSQLTCCTHSMEWKPESACTRNKGILYKNLETRLGNFNRICDTVRKVLAEKCN
jgi:hypothetical protein